MDNPQLKYSVALDHVPGLGLKEVAKLESRFGSPEAVWKAGVGELLNKGAKEVHAKAIPQLRQRHGDDYFLEKVLEKRIKAVALGSPAYPHLLSSIYDPPRVLYYSGDVDFDGKRAVAVVGTRLPSAYGKRMSQKLAYGLGALGITVVSGLARGVDTIAHNATLDANGRTVAVLGGALDRMYPADALPLARRIAQSGGAIISEYPPGVKAQRHHFPQRNRIISGLCAATLVVEGKHTSGAMITARQALDYNRDVLAVPGEADSPISSGTNGMIQRLEAKLVMTVEDITDELGLLKLEASANGAKRSSEPVTPPNTADLSPLEQRIVHALSEGEMHVDELVRAVAADTGEVTGELMKLEILGTVRSTGPMRFRLN